MDPAHAAIQVLAVTAIATAVTASSAGAQAQFEVAPAPALSIGVVDGAPEYTLAAVGDARLLPDGGIVLSDAAAGAVRFYSPAGEHIRSIGRHGGGPGEFRRGSRMLLCPQPDGSLAVEDGAQGRVHLFARTGAMLRVAALRSPQPGRSAGVGVDHCLPGGGWIASSHAPGRDRAALGQTYRLTHDYYRYSYDGRPLNALFRVEGRAHFMHEEAGSVRSRPVPLTLDPVVGAGRDAVYVGRSTAAAIHRYALEGGHEASFPLQRTPRRRREDVYDAWVAWQLGTIPDPRFRSIVARFFARRDLPVPEHAPAYQHILVDDDGFIWIERFRLPGEEAWWRDVYDPEGRFVSTVRMPPDLRVTQIRRDRLIGVHTDRLGVLKVRIHEVRRPPALPAWVPRHGRRQPARVRPQLRTRSAKPGASSASPGAVSVNPGAMSVRPGV